MVRIKVPRKYGVQREIELERSRQNADFNRRLKNAEDSMKAIYPEEYKKIRLRYFGNGNNLGLIGSQYNYIHDMITRRSDDQMKKYYNELNDYFIKQTGTQPGYMLPDVDVNEEYDPQGKIRDLTVVTPNSDYLNTVSANNAKQSVYNSDASAFNTGYEERLRDENPTAYDIWERAQNSPIVTAMEFSPLFPVVAGVKAVAAANAPQASGVDVGMNAAFAALPVVGGISKGIKTLKKANDVGSGFIPVVKNSNGDLKEIFTFKPNEVRWAAKRNDKGILEHDVITREQLPFEEKKKIVKDISSGIKYVSDYYGSPAYRIRSKKAKMPINDIVINNKIQIDPNFGNANSSMYFGREYANGDVAAHEVAHRNLLFNKKRVDGAINNDYVIDPAKNIDFSAYYGNDYTSIPKKIKRVLKPDFNPNDLHDSELSEAYSDLMSLRKSLEQNLDIDGKPYYSSTKEIGMPDIDRLKRYFANVPKDEIAKRYFINHTNNTGLKIDYNKIANALKIVPGVALPVAGGIGISNIYDSNNDEQQYYKSGGIHIKESHRGRLTRLKERTGKSEEELYRTGDERVRKMITFARNARKWKHDDGGAVPPFKSFDDWYRSITHNATDTSDYNLRRAYDLAPASELEMWRNDPDNHLHTGYWNGDVYEFMKSKNHPTVNYELEWYNSPDGDDFRRRYAIDTTGTTYRYVPRYKVRIIEP